MLVIFVVSDAERRRRQEPRDALDRRRRRRRHRLGRFFGSRSFVENFRQLFLEVSLESFDREEVVRPDIEPKIFGPRRDVEDGPELDPRHVGGDVEGPRPEQKMAKAADSDAGHRLVDLGVDFDLGD